MAVTTEALTLVRGRSEPAPKGVSVDLGSRLVSVIFDLCAFCERLLEHKRERLVFEQLLQRLKALGLIKRRGKMRTDSTSVSVVLPALNEAENLAHVLPRIPPWVDEVILVDGHSTDDTVAVAQALLPSIRIVQQEGRGKGAALRSGFAAAIGDIVVHLDADGSTDPTEIPAFVGALLAGADYAKGSRFVQGAGTDDMTALRKVGSWGLVKAANLFFGTHFSDITYGYNAVWRRYAQDLALEIDGWACEIVGNIRAARAGLRVVEVASHEHPRIAGEAKLATFRAGWSILKAMLRERLLRHACQIRPQRESTSAAIAVRSTGMRPLSQTMMLNTPPCAPVPPGRA